MSHTKKRVRFSEEGPDMVDNDNSAGDEESFKRETLLPEAGEHLAGQPEVEDEGPIKATDPGLAAALRARHRKEIDNLKAGEALDISLLDDVALAEEQEDEPELRFTEDGIPIEPFNLKAERAQGYFDAEGNYVAYRTADDTDAWLESLPGGPVSAGAAKSRQKKLPDDNVEGRPEMTEADRLTYRERIVAQLMPGESVLEALKRLGTSDSPSPSDSGKAGESKAEKLAALRSRISGTVPETNKEAFNSLTEDAGQLLNAGETNVYTETREELLAILRHRRTSSRGGRSQRQSIPSDGFGAVMPELRCAQAEQMNVDSDEAAAPVPRKPVDQIDDMFADAPNTNPPRTGDTSQPLEAGVHTRRTETSSPPSARLGTCQSGGGQSNPLAEADLGGFELDKDSGMYYNSTLGCYYDAQKQLYRDAGTGLWYHYRDGKYEPVSV